MCLICSANCICRATTIKKVLRLVGDEGGHFDINASDVLDIEEC